MPLYETMVTLGQSGTQGECRGIPGISAYLLRIKRYFSKPKWGVPDTFRTGVGVVGESRGFALFSGSARLKPEGRTNFEDGDFREYFVTNNVLQGPRRGGCSPLEPLCNRLADR
jgi:hypothetical protein